MSAEVVFDVYRWRAIVFLLIIIAAVANLSNRCCHHRVFITLQLFAAFLSKQRLAGSLLVLSLSFTWFSSSPEQRSLAPTPLAKQGIKALILRSAALAACAVLRLVSVGVPKT